jgi:hypothetical protein
VLVVEVDLIIQVQVLLVALVVEAEVVEVALAKQGVQVTLLLQLQLKVFLVDRVEPQEQVVAEVEQLEQEQEE